MPQQRVVGPNQVRFCRKAPAATAPDRVVNLQQRSNVPPLQQSGNKLARKEHRQSAILRQIAGGFSHACNTLTGDGICVTFSAASLGTVIRCTSDLPADDLPLYPAHRHQLFAHAGNPPTAPARTARRPERKTPR